MPRTGRPRKDWPIDDLREAVEIKGMTPVEAGRSLGIPHKHISTLCKRHGIKCQRRGPRSGEGHPDWKGGRVLLGGYWHIYCPGHPRARKNGPPYVLESRLVMENVLGRYLDSKEVVHHINGDRGDNRPENLELFSKNSEHLRRELKGRCPNWTEDGKRRILDGATPRNPNPFGLGLDDSRSKEKNLRSPKPRGTAVPEF